MRPEFGCAIHDLVFARPTPRPAGRIASRCSARWTAGSRASTWQDVAVDLRRSIRTSMIDITYSIRGTNDPRNLVFPFYTIPPEE